MPDIATKCLFLTGAVLALVGVTMAQDDFSDPIKCYYCIGQADNSSCADPINPRRDKGGGGNMLDVIECERGICLKWTYYKDNVLFMHRTCSLRHSFRIMMIDGVCRSERTGNGYLCMCGKHLCNGATAHADRKYVTWFIPLLIGLYLSQQFVASSTVCL